MASLQRIAVCLLFSVIATSLANPSALATGRSGVRRVDGPLSDLPQSLRARACSELSGPAFTLCNAFCEGCAARSGLYCEGLRRSFRQLTRRSTFPCEKVRSLVSTPTPTPTSTPTSSPTPTKRSCPLRAGLYRFGQIDGGTLKPAGLEPFAFPAGGNIVQDVGPPDDDCVHQTVVPFPGGFIVPTFCIAGLNLSVSVVQTGCGVGQIDSDGGSDYTIAEVGDTSSPTVCSLPHTGCSSGADAAAEVAVAVGDGVPDVCTAGTANAILTVPVQTTAWTDDEGQCPDPDGMYDPGSDSLVLSFPQIFDLSTDATSADWRDIDPDGCCIAGAGPASMTNPCQPGGVGGLSASGVCMDLSTRTITLAASGVSGSSTAPLFDITFTVELPSIVGGPDAPLDATCPAPPPIEFKGTRTRCIGSNVEPHAAQALLRRDR